MIRVHISSVWNNICNYRTTVIRILLYFILLLLLWNKDFSIIKVLLLSNVNEPYSQDNGINTVFNNLHTTLEL